MFLPVLCKHFVPQDEVEEALEALSTLIDVSVSCDTGLLCSGATASICSVEFLTELGDVPLVSVSASNIDSIDVTEYQASPLLVLLTFVVFNLGDNLLN